MKEIHLTRGMVALVDDDLYEHLSQWKWCVTWSGFNWYAARTQTLPNKKQQRVYMHREVLNAPPGTQVDHVSGDRLDNTRQNLRLATNQQNSCNRPAQSRNTSGYKGVSFDKARGKWDARIMSDGTQICLGRYATKEEAARAYNEASMLYHGEFARLNSFGLDGDK
jgi:hypothetical protein